MIMLMTILCFVGCARPDGVIDEKDLKEDIELTSKEEDFLLQEFAKDEEDEERIKENDLYSSEKICVLRMRIATEYLKEKYPDEEFEFVYYEDAKYWGLPYTYFEFVEDGNDEVTYEVRLEAEEEDDEYEISDTFCNHLIQGKYDEYFAECLEDSGFNDCITDTTFSYPLGKNVNGELSGEELWKMREDLSGKTKIFVEGAESEAEELSEDIKELILEKEWKGAYNIYVIEDMDDDVEAVKEYIKDNEDEVYELIFQTWNE